MRQRVLKSKRLETESDRTTLLNEPSFLKDEHVNHLLSQLIKHVLDEMKVSCCGIWLADKEGGLMPRIVFGVKEELYNLTHSVRFTRLLHHVIKTKAYLAIHDLTRFKEIRLRQAIRKEKLQSLLAYPILINDVAIGVLVICRRINEPAFTKYRIRIGRIIAQTMALSLKNLYLYKRSVEFSRFALFLTQSDLRDRLETTSLSVVRKLIQLTEAKDRYTQGHSRKVMQYSLMICKGMKLSKNETALIKEAALLHDLGKLAINAEILKKRGKLNRREWQQIKRHPIVGAEIVSKMGLSPELVSVIKHHHERFGGGGYPNPNLKSQDIPLGARILAVADAFDAMSSARPYRRAMSKEAAIIVLYICSGLQFDPQVVRIFTRTLRNPS